MPVDLMVNISKLSNGITVVLEPMNYLRSVSFGVWIKAGSVNETEQNNGISHMLEHMFFKGTQSRTAKMLADDMAMLGGNMNAYTSKECTSIYVTTLDEHLPNAIEMISDMLIRSKFDEKDIEKEKGVIIEEIDMYEDSPEDLVHEMLQQNIWTNQSIGYIISGEKSIVNSFTREQIIAYKEQYYTADRIVISVAGSFRVEQILELLEQYFGEIKKTCDVPEIKTPVYNRCFCSKAKDIEQIHMNIAFDSIDYNSMEKYALSIVNSLLGGSENSRLFQRIREEQGLTYSIFTYGSSYENAGLFHIDAALGPNKVIDVYEQIFDVILEMKKKGITELELNRTKEQINTELIIGCESTKNRMNYNGKAMLNRGEIIPLDETIRRLNLVTIEDVHSFMERYFMPSTSSLCLVGNIKQVKLDNMKKVWEQL